MKGPAGTNNKPVLLICLVLCFCINICHALPGNYNAAITVLKATDKSPLPDAVVTVVSLNQANRKINNTTGLTDPRGLFHYMFSEPVIVQVSHIGYNVITDTIMVLGDKTYLLTTAFQNMQDVVVTGQYGSAKPNESLYDVKIISQDMLRSSGANNLRDALQNNLNIDLGQDQVFGSYMSINGISGEGIKLLVDGVPIQGRLGGSIDLSQINLNDVDHIEIVEGPLSVVYGTDAMGGVINIITKQFQRQQINLNLKAYYESVGQYNIELNGGFAFKKNQLFFSAGRYFFSGFSLNDSIPRVQEWLPREQYFADGKYIYTGNKFRITASGSFQRELMLQRGAPTLTLDSTASGQEWTYIGDDTHFLTYRAMSALSFMYKFRQDQQLDVLLGYSGFWRYTDEYEKNLVNLTEQLIPDPTTRDTNIYHNITVRATYNMPAWKNRLNFQTGIDVNQQYLIEGMIAGGNQQLGDYAAFGSARFTIIEGLDIQPAVRFSYDTKYDVPLIPSLNIRYAYRDKILLRASYGRGYRAPGLEELYEHFVDANHYIIGNTGLKAEDGENVNGSLSYTQKAGKHNLTYSITGFYNNIKNEINWAQLPLTNATLGLAAYQYINLNRYITYGGTAGVGYRWNGLHMGASMQITAYNLSVDSGVAAPFKMWSPDILLTAGYMIPKALIGVNISYKYTGLKPAFALNSNLETGNTAAYNMLNASLTRDFWHDRIQVTIGAKNLLGVTSVTAYNLTGVGHNIDSSSADIGWGRTYFVTLLLHYSQ